ncbi:radical SAM protein [Candidatus Bathyarchaeota archaeon]|nr:radical SAM protein [Candidatus Bathyarchaeota archaeon]
MKTPRKKIHFHITEQCGNNCRHCSVDAGPGKSRLLTRDDLRRAMDWASDTGASTLEISGGEPLTLGNDLYWTIRYANDRGLHTSLLTNGCMLDEKTAERLRLARIAAVGISVYGSKPETHDDFTRTRGSFKAMLDGIRNAKRQGLDTVADIVVTPKNLSELHILPHLLEEVDVFTFASIVPSGRGANAKGYEFTDKDYEEVVERIEAVFSGRAHYFLNSLYSGRLDELERYCSRPVEETVIDPGGRLIACCLLPYDLQTRGLSVTGDSVSATMNDDPVSQWLICGHGSMRKRVNNPPTSRNLCSNCIEMLRLLVT